MRLPIVVRGTAAHHFGRAAMLIHDGTAAGGSVASDEPTAVIMLGTSIGVGFAPAADSVRPLAPDFRLRRRPRDG